MTEWYLTWKDRSDPVGWEMSMTDVLIIGSSAERSLIETGNTSSDAPSSQPPRTYIRPPWKTALKNDFFFFDFNIYFLPESVVMTLQFPDLFPVILVVRIQH